MTTYDELAEIYFSEGQPAPQGLIEGGKLIRRQSAERFAEALFAHGHDLVGHDIATSFQTIVRRALDTHAKQRRIDRLRGKQAHRDAIARRYEQIRVDDHNRPRLAIFARPHGNVEIAPLHPPKSGERSEEA